MKKLKSSLIVGAFVLSFFASHTQVKAANVSAWLPSWEVEQAFDSFQTNAQTIDVISPFWYHVNGDGTITPTENAEDQAIIDFAKANGIPIIPTISNSFDGQKISGFLNDEALRAENIQNIMDAVLEFDYDGIDIDYEGSLAADIDVFTDYMRVLDEALDAEGKKLTIAVMSKSYPMLAGFGERGQDWPALSQYVDEFRIMTYDYGWRGSNPRPVAPHYWVEEVVQYAVDHVPAEKIRLGVPFYSYAWSDNGVEGQKEFYSYTYEGILGILETYGVDLQYDPRERTNRLFYVSQFDERDPVAPFEIWIENHVSLEAKLDLVEKYNLGGIAIWRLGREDVANWALIEERLKDVPMPEAAYFEDVTAETPYADSINELAFLGLVTGQGNTGLFDSLSLVNRAEILKMSLNSFAVDTSDYIFPSQSAENEENVEEVTVSPFVDVSLEAWYFPYIQTAVKEDVAEGYPDGLFRPGNNIIRVEALKLALESADVDLSAYDDTTWYVPYRDWAFDHGLYDPQTFVKGEEITRGEAAYIIDKVIEVVEAEPQFSVFNQ